RRYWKALRLYVYETEDHLRWPAVEAIARLMQHWWQQGREENVKEYIRGLFWSLNDESGGIGWNAPQIIAETIVLVPVLLDPYGSMMIDRTMEESLLVKSGLWGIGWLGPQIYPAVEFFRDEVLRAFASDDVETLGMASWAMGTVGFAPALRYLKNLVNRREAVRIYVDGDLREKPLGEWAREAISRIDNLRL
ncbi:MAG: hypothetical protein SVM79_03385, partial [Chloroflexota bacterium]|nr:hypothetical protein [Chloroflexota bacterium]